MQALVYKHQKELRQGYTTGSCAAAATQAAAMLLLTGQAPGRITLHTPKGDDLHLTPEFCHMDGAAAVCAIRKDSGDDPDVTNGIRIFASVSKLDEDVQIEGGTGIGRVTRPGLANPVGEAAINPGPRAQIMAAAEKAALLCGYDGGFRVVISAENGEEIAKQTYNGHLGVVGGISILGTSGIVEPMSEAAIMETTHLELDSVYASGQRIAFLCPGNYGADFARDTLGLDLERAVKSSNFIGDAIDYAAYKGFAKILLIGHAGKLVKLAAGVMNTHSSVADGRQEVFTAYAALCGAPRETLEGLMNAITVDACIDLLDQAGLREEVLARIGKAIEMRLAARVRGKCSIEYMTFTNRYGMLVHSAGAPELCKELQECL